MIFWQIISNIDSYFETINVFASPIFLKRTYKNKNNTKFKLGRWDKRHFKLAV